MGLSLHHLDGGGFTVITNKFLTVLGAPFAKFVARVLLFFKHISHNVYHIDLLVAKDRRYCCGTKKTRSGISI